MNDIIRVGPVGMEAIDFLPDNLGLRLFGSADLGRVHKLDGIISGFAGESLDIQGNGAKVEVQAGRHEDAPRLSVSPDHVSLEGVHDFSVIHPETGEVLFSTSDPELALPEGLQKLEAEEAEVGRVSAPVGEDLLVRSDANLMIRGSEGIQARREMLHHNQLSTTIWQRSKELNHSPKPITASQQRHDLILTCFCSGWRQDSFLDLFLRHQPDKRRRWCGVVRRGRSGHSYAASWRWRLLGQHSEY